MRRHDAPERPGMLAHVIVIASLIAIVVAWRAVVGMIGYGDWTCGFVHCVKVKD